MDKKEDFDHSVKDDGSNFEKNFINTNRKIIKKKSNTNLFVKKIESSLNMKNKKNNDDLRSNKKINWKNVVIGTIELSIFVGITVIMISNPATISVGLALAWSTGGLASAVDGLVRVITGLMGVETPLDPTNPVDLTEYIIRNSLGEKINFGEIIDGK